MHKEIPFCLPLDKDRIIYSEGSHHRCSIKIGVLRNFAKFTGKHLQPYLKIDSGTDVFL